MAKIGFIGMGNMGYAMLKGALKVFEKDDILFTRKNSVLGRSMEEETVLQPLTERTRHPSTMHL